MLEKIKKLFKDKCGLFIAALLICNLFVLFYVNRDNNKVKREIEEIEYLDSMNRYHKVYYEGQIKDLKKQNKELYDSIKASKDKISYLVQFNATHSYSTGRVYIEKEVHDTIYQDVLVNEELEAKTFEYSNEKNDTMNYTLKVNSEKEPNWYELDFSVSNQYTIINKDYGDGLNHISIDGGQTTDISDVTVFKKKEKKSPFRKFAIGPTVSYGYDVQHGRFGPTVGVGVTYNIFGK
jgi:hypothetical protein